jgi:hypothetical protein
VYDYFVSTRLLKFYIFSFFYRGLLLFHVVSGVVLNLCYQSYNIVWGEQNMFACFLQFLLFIGWDAVSIFIITIVESVWFFVFKQLLNILFVVCEYNVLNDNVL